MYIPPSFPPARKQVLSAGLYSTKFIGGFEISKQRRVEDSTPGPVQLVSAEQQRRALTLILKIVGGEEPGGSASFLPAGNDFSNMATRGGWCNGLEQDCYAVTPVDVLGEVSEGGSMWLASVDKRMDVTCALQSEQSFNFF